MASDEQIWQQLLSAHYAFNQANNQFNQPHVDRVSLMRNGIHRDIKERRLVILMLSVMKPHELQDLFPELIGLASWGHGAVGTVREAILRIPHEWLLIHIEPAAENYLRDGTEDEFRRFLELYDLIDPNLTNRLATRAMNHTDPEIREAGNDYFVNSENS